MKHSASRLFPLIVLSTLAGCQSAAPLAASDAPIGQALRDWASAFNACMPKRSAALYAPEALLWGTVSPALIDTPEGVLQYFERACLATPQPKVELGPSTIRVQGDSATASGTYVFTLGLQGQVRTVPARFSFTYHRSAQGWLVTSHHSSAMPAAAQAGSAAPTR